MEAEMAEEKSKLEQENQALADVQNGSEPDPSLGLFYQNAYAYYKQQAAPPPPQDQNS